MRNSLLPLSAVALMLPVMSVLAQSTSSSSHRPYDTSHLGNYNDVSGWDLSTRVAVSVLTDAGIVQGDPSGAYRADDTINRAEFVKIVMGLLPGTDNKEFLRCFPDVPSGVWYEAPVCRAKSMGIVRGNVDTRVDPSQWRFEPNRPVQYEEAVKVLVKLYAYPAVETNGNDWYVAFLNTAHQRGVDLSGVVVGDKLTRGEMARLTANFLAYSEGDLDLLRAAQNGDPSPRSSSSSSRKSSSSSSSSRMSSSSSNSSRVGTYDTLTDRTAVSNMFLLGQTSPILAGAKFFSNNEPLQVTSLSITLNSPVSSVDALLVYDQDGFFLGTATLQQGSSSMYKLTLPTGKLTLPRRVDHSIYVRARLKTSEGGGVSGEAIQVANIEVSGNGEWSNDSYTNSSTDVFNISQTTRARITSVTNAGPATGLVTSGTDQLLGSFTVNTLVSDTQSHVVLQQIRFQIQATAGVQVTNLKLRQEGSDTTVSCSISGNVATCSSIPSTLGTITGNETFRVYGDVTVQSNAANPNLSLSINEPGTTTMAGDITYSDGTTTYTWMPGSAPVVRLTQFQ